MSDVLKKLEDGAFSVNLSEDKDTLEFIEGLDHCRSVKLNKEELAELIGELKILFHQMNPIT